LLEDIMKSIEKA